MTDNAPTVESTVYQQDCIERFNDGKIKIYQGDCMDLLRNTPDKFYSLACVDPPYGIGEDGRNNHTRGKLCKAKDYRQNARYDNQAPDKPFFDQLIRVSANQIIWGANHLISRFPLDSPCWIVWDKDNGNTDFADCELAYSSFPTALRKVKFRWQGMLQGDMKNKQVRIHPNEKPAALYRWLLANYAKPGDTILDTHMGSGSLALACHDMGYSLDAIELDEEYCTAAVARLKTHQSQLSIFQP